MYETKDFRKGIRVELDGTPFIMTESQFVKPGKGQAFCRVKLKNLLNGSVMERTYKSGEKIPKADVSEVTMQYLYEDTGKYNFMDSKSYEQIELTKDQLGDGYKWIKEQMDVDVVLYKGLAISVTLPNFSVLEITFCEPGLKGDTATGATKPATVETGATILVPLFVEQGDKVKIDTRTGSYIERSK